MKKLLNTLFVTTPESYLHKEGETVVIKVENEQKAQFPLHALNSIICFGQVSMSPFLMATCAEKSIAVTFCTETGRFLASVHGKIHGNVILRREQYRKADDDIACANLTRSFLVGKIANSRNVINRALRDHADKLDSVSLNVVSEKASVALDQLMKSGSVDSMRGLEGEMANAYFDVFDHLIISQKDAFKFDGRNRRPPRDNVNCLLSFIYTMLAHDTRSALESVGLDPYVGFLHKDRSGRPGLALDLMEEFRAMLGDRLVLSLINRDQVSPKGFKHSESGAVIMDDETRKEVIAAYQKRKQDEVFHPFFKENVKIGLLFYTQALLLARHLRGDLDGYPVFFWK